MTSAPNLGIDSTFTGFAPSGAAAPAPIGGKSRSNSDGTTVGCRRPRGVSSTPPVTIPHLARGGTTELDGLLPPTARHGLRYRKAGALFASLPHPAGWRPIGGAASECSRPSTAANLTGVERAARRGSLRPTNRREPNQCQRCHLTIRHRGLRVNGVTLDIRW